VHASPTAGFAPQASPLSGPDCRFVGRPLTESSGSGTFPPAKGLSGDGVVGTAHSYSAGSGAALVRARDVYRGMLVVLAESSMSHASSDLCCALRLAFTRFAILLPSFVPLTERPRQDFQERKGWELTQSRQGKPYTRCQALAIVRGPPLLALTPTSQKSSSPIHRQSGSQGEQPVGHRREATCLLPSGFLMIPDSAQRLAIACRWPRPSASSVSHPGSYAADRRSEVRPSIRPPASCPESGADRIPAGHGSG